MLSATLIAALAGSSAAATLSNKPPASALRLRGGNIEQIATGLAYASSAFILLPAGRDIVSYKTCILPGEDTTRPLMNPSNPKAETVMWGIWGLNHCFITLLKLMAIRARDKPMLQMLFWVTAATFGYCATQNPVVAEEGGDLTGFVAVCAVQTASIGYLAFA